MSNARAGVRAAPRRGGRPRALTGACAFTYKNVPCSAQGFACYYSLFLASFRLKTLIGAESPSKGGFPYFFIFIFSILSMLALGNTLFVRTESFNLLHPSIRLSP